MTQPITVTHEQAVETLAQMVKDGYNRISELEQEIAKYVWATKTYWRVECDFGDGKEWIKNEQRHETPESAAQMASKFKRWKTRIIKVETIVFETEVTA